MGVPRASERPRTSMRVLRRVPPCIRGRDGARWRLPSNLLAPCVCTQRCGSDPRACVTPERPQKCVPTRVTVCARGELEIKTWEAKPRGLVDSLLPESVPRFRECARVLRDVTMGEAVPGTAVLFLLLPVAPIIILKNQRLKDSGGEQQEFHTFVSPQDKQEKKGGEW